MTEFENAGTWRSAKIDESREAHLQWCKQRALEYVLAGDLNSARSSMMSDITKHDPPLYDEQTLVLLGTDGMLFRKTPDDVRNWIEGFN